MAQIESPLAPEFPSLNYAYDSARQAEVYVVRVTQGGASLALGFYGLSPLGWFEFLGWVELLARLG